MSSVRVRFAPSPTGALHIGGLRTALYNYLFARKNGGTFVLRIEDTDQKRYVEGAEAYIRESLHWAGLTHDEGPEVGGDYGPYRQSERSNLYKEYTHQLLEDERAYYAFDTEDELAAARAADPNFRYDATTRGGLRNSLSLGEAESQRLLAAGTPHVVRLRVEPGRTVQVNDLIRGGVTFQSDEIDDKVLMKADGLPTYHLANVVDDHLMEISHVIRGEEWLPSTALHVLLYRAFGWEEEMPAFAHLPLLLKPTGKGKLSKRDAAKLGIPVFPLDWEGPDGEQLVGFREYGILPEATVNFLAFLGWNPGTEQEMFSLEELVEAFSLDRVNNSGARFDFDKALWYNQQYLIATPDAELAPLVQKEYAAHGHELSDEKASRIAGLLKERVQTLPEFYSEGRYFVAPPEEIDRKVLRKKYKQENVPAYQRLHDRLAEVSDWQAPTIKQAVVDFMEAEGFSFGAVLPVLRLAVSGTLKGPDAFGILEVVGKEESLNRLRELNAQFA